MGLCKNPCSSFGGAFQIVAPAESVSNHEYPGKLVSSVSEQYLLWLKKSKLH